ncbi:uncharacterized protein SPPG_06407 [Spizellomyces punctatus DAOM BR117]|uniref:Saccharopine dehydrogenase NADP binding domain-containing protein n=1 Tax=Spizellomyces punctatus (strain DAOM BR117) TaxID=645134 RepID=A0A0L0HCT8_SPIPD|nr:uncharacterized protein SPPG_06407 [Spizellomyces punctatus DAOM BR117]KNC98729.1 hypothetical protein SPPG_06407 [Spizellomyces punctatus DAOM BR117]|eukprot:XP_016606769.1 hypothetical protein SPPG_06407 [Spizellomyces punctatus DAOM BR117]
MSKSKNPDRPYHIIVWGATGFTGSLVAEYLAQHAPKNVKFAIAGRSQKKLEDVRNKVAKLAPERKNIPLIIADSGDEASLDKLVSQTRVIISTVGPFLKYGIPLVGACVRNQTDYVDITGEPPFIREIIDKYHDEAVKNGTFIVPSCGFDSLPSDLGTLLVADHFAKQGKKTASVRMSVDALKGGPSGGTVASLMGVLTETSYKEQWKMLDPYYLNPRDAPKGPDSSIPSFFGYDRDLKKWQTYFVMEAINTRNVRRSNALLGLAYGPDLRYTETHGQPGFLSASAISVGSAVAGTMMVVPPFQWAAKWAANKFIPAGTGPTRKEIEEGFFRVKLVGEAVKEANEEKPLKAIATVTGVQDPGYGETSKMLSESALCLALDRDRLSTKEAGSFAGKVNGGVVTAASSMGMVLVERLRKAGMGFEVQNV